MDNKICRFCLLEENNSTDDILECFDDTIHFFTQNVLKILGIDISAEDVFPRMICKSCSDFIKKVLNFLKTIQQSEHVLCEIEETKNRKLLRTDKNISNSDEASKTELPVHQSNTRMENNFENIDQNPYALIFCHSSSDNGEMNNAPIKLVNELSLPDIHKKESVSYSCQESDKVKIFQTDCEIYYCSICSTEFTNFCDYENHQQLHEVKSATCLKCNKVFLNRDELAEHEKTHKVACGECNIKVLPSSLEAHMKKHSDIHKCITCDARHTSKAAMEKHYQARHAGIKGSVCHICGKQNSCQSSMKRHLASHFAHRPFMCKFCTFSAKSRTVLQVHISRKHSNQQCDCEICLKKFKSVLSLKQHIKRMHNPKKYQCMICEKAFSEKFNLDQHIFKKHSKQRLYECKLCHKEFFTVKKLKDHMHSHREGCVSCPKCAKEFFYKKYLDKHLLKCSVDDESVLTKLKNTSSMPNNTCDCNE
nr:zinc finger protein 184-like [Leptinotarsa decemlineata]